MMRSEKPPGAFRIRDVCWMHEDMHQEPMRINPALPFAPVTFFSPSSPRSPPASVVVTDWESRTLIDGSGSRFSACRAGVRSGALMVMTVPSRFHGASSRDIFGCSKNRQNRIVENSTYPLDDFGFR
jgi:hypothetical protein